MAKLGWHHGPFSLPRLVVDGTRRECCCAGVLRDGAAARWRVLEHGCQLLWWSGSRWSSTRMFRGGGDRGCCGGRSGSAQILISPFASPWWFTLEAGGCAGNPSQRWLWSALTGGRHSRLTGWPPSRYEEAIYGELESPGLSCRGGTSPPPYSGSAFPARGLVRVHWAAMAAMLLGFDLPITMPCGEIWRLSCCFAFAIHRRL